MKKYDLIIGAVYILPVILGFVIFYNLKNPTNREIEKAKAYFEELEKQPVNTVVIRETDMFIRVYKTAKKMRKGFKLTGALSVRQAAGWRVSGDTLYVENRYNQPTALDLWLSPDVKVDISNAPSVSVREQKVEKKGN